MQEITAPTNPTVTAVIKNGNITFKKSPMRPLLALDLLGFGSIADAVKSAEWIGAIFGFLGWAFLHPSTLAILIGAGFVFAVLHKGWPVENVPEINTFLGKAIVLTGLLLVVGGFGWRAADEVLGSHPAKASVEAPGKPQNGQSGPLSPAPQGNAPKNSIPQGNNG